MAKKFKYIARFKGGKPGRNVRYRSSASVYTHAWVVISSTFPDGISDGSFSRSEELARRAANSWLRGVREYPVEVLGKSRFHDATVEVVAVEVI